jgi:hypothetical protein
MDEWRQRLFGELVPETSRPTTDLTAATALEIAIGMARSEVAYVLELGRAHKLPVAGNVNGDDVWLAIGGARARFTYDRRKGVIAAVVPGHEDATIAWDATAHALRGPAAGGAAFDARTFVRTALDAVVAAWKSAPPGAPPPRWDAPPQAPAALPEETKKTEG